MSDVTPGQVCLDASLALKLVLIEDRTDIALALWRDWLASGTTVVAPSLITWEVASAVRKVALQGRLPRSSVADLYQEFAGLPVELVPHDRLPVAAWEDYVLGYDLRVSPYDATYIATASLLECELWTADDRLVRTVGDELPWVRSLSEFGDDVSEEPQ